MNNESDEKVTKIKELAWALQAMFQKQEISVSVALASVRMFSINQALASMMLPEDYEELMKKEASAYKAFYFLEQAQKHFGEMDEPI
jgi:hypothetical protein